MDKDHVVLVDAHMVQEVVERILEVKEHILEEDGHVDMEVEEHILEEEEEGHTDLDVVEHILEEEEVDSMEVVELDIQVVEDHAGLEVVVLAFLVDNHMVDSLILYKLRNKK